MRLTIFVALLILGTLSLQAQTVSQAQTASFERGAVVLIQQDGRAMAPRVLAIAGDRVRVGSDGVFVNDEYVPAPHDLGSWPQSVVPKGHYFVLAESKSSESTTRFWGLIPAEWILGKAEL
jgi:signal peptidase I